MRSVGPILSAVLLCAAPLALRAQDMIQSETVRARAIEGYLEDTNGYAVQHAAVDVIECPASWPKGTSSVEVLRSGESDETGKFKIEDVSGGQLRCVRVHKKGFAPLVVRVKLTMFALEKMQLKLQREVRHTHTPPEG